MASIEPVCEPGSPQAPPPEAAHDEGLRLIESGDAPKRTLESLLEDLANDGRLVHVERFSARPAHTAELRQPFPTSISDKLGFEGLWTHQAQAIDLIRSGTSVAISTGTASGKSLCYQLPIAEAVVDPIRPGTSLALFPTKALAQDQVRSLAVHGFDDVICSTYDGDTARRDRAWIRDNANVVFTNPEMLHGGILPHHGRWANFLMRLRYVVVDELHILRGIFGTHVAHILRRLLRVCRSYGAEPTFIFCSATIGDPAKLASELCGLPVTAITSDGSPRGPRTFALLNPPVVDEATGARTSANSETASVAAELIGLGHRTIAFCGSRKGTELVASDIVSRLPDDDSAAVRPYRGGYLPAERRAIEAELFSGELKGVVATTALELGVDVGGLDACVLNGFPGTIASMWQQAGRAGRSQDPSVAVLVAGDDQLDQWMVSHPTELFTRSPEPAVINTSNPFILAPHLASAAFEKPLTHADELYWGDDLADGVRELVVANKLRLRKQRRGPSGVWSGRGFPSRGISLRSGSCREFRISLADGTLIGTVDESRAFDLVHPGAIYLHQGRSFRVLDLDLDDLVAIVERDDGREYTQARSNTDISVLDVEQSNDLGLARLCLGRVEVTTTVTGYQRKQVRSRRILGNELLDLPPSRLVTRSFWYEIDPEVFPASAIVAGRVPGTLHAVEHAAIGLLPLFTICDRWDVGGVSVALHADTDLPTFFVYDGYPGGAGIAELGYAASVSHLQATVEVIRACPCTEGCPSCVQSPKCGNGNEPLDKEGAALMLEAILAAAR